MVCKFTNRKRSGVVVALALGLCAVAPRPAAAQVEDRFPVLALAGNAQADCVADVDTVRPTPNASVMVLNSGEATTQSRQVFFVGEFAPGSFAGNGSNFLVECEFTPVVRTGEGEPLQIRAERLLVDLVVKNPGAPGAIDVRGRVIVGQPEFEQTIAVDQGGADGSRLQLMFDVSSLPWEVIDGGGSVNFKSLIRGQDLDPGAQVSIERMELVTTISRTSGGGAN